jgi:N utilization substance protein B
MAKGSRRQARVAALQALFEADKSTHTAPEALERVITSQRVPSESAQYARQLLEGVLAQQDEIDTAIAGAATAWPIEQLAAVDRNVLRLAIREMLEDNGTPVEAVINEAVELAKQFGSESSARFVNGVLGTIERRRQEANPNHATAQRR